MITTITIKLESENGWIMLGAIEYLREKVYNINSDRGISAIIKVVKE